MRSSIDAGNDDGAAPTICSRYTPSISSRKTGSANWLRFLSIPGDDRARRHHLRRERHTTDRAGTHDELLAAGGFYAGLYNIQFGEPATALA
jgi:hypothetical protein